MSARCTYGEAVRFPDEPSEEPCEARSQEGARELRSVSTDRRSLPKAVARVVPQGPVRGEKKKLFWLFSISKRTGEKWRGAPHYRDYMLFGDLARMGISCTFVCREGGVRVPARRRSPNGRGGRAAIGETTRPP